MSVSPKSILLASCSVVTFAPNEVAAGALGALAGKLGFGPVTNYGQGVELPRNALTFFLIHGQVPDASKTRIIHGLRSSDQAFRRFAPIVCFVTSGPRHQTVPLVQMGFDEVLFAGDDFGDMVHKLDNQVQREQLYIESEHYFGPDRRRIERVDPNDPRRKLGGGQFRKIRVFRDPRSGISTMDAA